MKNFKISIVILALISLISAKVSAQNPNFAVRIENEQSVSSTEYQFDIVLYATGATTTWEMAGFTVGIGVNPTWRNSATISTTASTLIMTGTSDMNTSPNQVPSSGTFSTATPNRLQIASTSAPGAGSGTIITQAGKRLCRVKLLATAGSFSTTASPNLYWLFSGYATSLSAYVGGVNTTIANSGIAAATNAANMRSPKYFDGTQWNSSAWSTGTTYIASTAAPTSSDEATVYNGTYSGNLTCRSLHVVSGAGITIGSGNTATIAGQVRNNGTINASAGTISLTGTSDQTITGTGTVSVKTFNVTGGTKTLSQAVAVYGGVTLGSSTTLASGGNMTLKSLAGAGNTAFIAAIPSGSSVTGNVTCERFIPAVARRWRFLSSPVATNVADWQNELFITGPGTGTTVGSTNSNGFDATLTNSPSMYWYNETTGSNDINSRWVVPTGSSENLVAGRGYRVYVRGPKTDGTGLLNGTQNTQNAVTLTSVGVVNQGSVSFPNVTYSNPQLGASWVLVGNPYPCPIDWNAVSGWTKTNIQNRMWIWDPSANSYAIYDASLGVVAGTITQNIPSGQAFWIKTTGSSPALACTESVKSATVPVGLFKSSANNVLRMKITFDELNSDEASIFFRDGFTDTYSDNEDVAKLANPTVNISSDFGNNLYAAGNCLSSNFTDKIVPLNVWGSAAGEYSLSFSEIESFAGNTDIYLEDMISGTVTKIEKDMTVKVVLTDEDVTARKGDSRFRLVFHKNTTGIADLSNIHKLNVFPVPAVDVVTVTNNSLPHGNYEANIYDQAGRLISSRKTNNIEVLNGLKLNVTDMASGAYIVELLNSKDGFRTATKIVK